MPQQPAAQKNRQSLARPITPRPLPDTDPAETADHEYALVSVLYHSLQGVQACEQYVEDAESAGDQELVTFFQECRDEQASRANRAKQLLAGVMEVEEEDDEDEDDEDDDESEEGKDQDEEE